MISRIRRVGLVLVIAGAAIGPLWLSPTAEASCGIVVTDYVPGLHTMMCRFESGAEESWTVPSNISKPTFTLHGADDPLQGRGGYVIAKVPVKAGETFELVSGAEGMASSVRRDDEAVLTAGGGDGNQPNFLGPEAELVDLGEPGEPVGPSPGNGWISVEWYDARTPFNLTNPLPFMVIDIPDGQKSGFHHTGAPQSWTAPPGVDRAIFELVGGLSESTEPRGHIVAGLDLVPGETFGVSVGGPGKDTVVSRSGTLEVMVAAGSDSERPNYLPPNALPADEFWEGGGDSSQPLAGRVVVHWSFPTVAPPPPDSDFTGARIRRDDALTCVVPKLRKRTRKAAYRVLVRSNCAMGKVRIRPRSDKDSLIVVRQKPGPGTVTEVGKPVAITLGGG